MLHITEKQAIILFRKNMCEVFLLLDEGIEGIAKTVTDISLHVERGGVLGIEEDSVSGRIRYLLINERKISTTAEKVMDILIKEDFSIDETLQLFEMLISEVRKTKRNYTVNLFQIYSTTERSNGNGGHSDKHSEKPQIPATEADSAADLAGYRGGTDQQIR